MKKFLLYILILLFSLMSVGAIEKIKVPDDEENLENIVIAVCWVESDYGRIKRGTSGERGPMQIMRNEWEFTTHKLMGIDKKTNLLNGKDYSWDSAFNPVKNIKVGRIYLNYLYSKYSNWEIVIRVYHSGVRGYFKLHKGVDYWEAIQKTLNIGDTSWRISKKHIIKKKVRQ